MAQHLWYYLKHHVYAHNDEEHRYLVSYVRHYYFRKRWRRWSRDVVRHIIERKDNNFRVQFLTKDKQMIADFITKNFLGERKPWKRDNDYTIARYKYEWGRRE
jgi:hypothetical protein